MGRRGGNYSITIGADRPWYRLGLAELWTNRELVRFLVSRDVRVRYKQTILGIFWAVLQPLLTTIVFTLVFSANIPAERLPVPYPLFALSGLMLWFFINSSVTRGAWSLLTNRNLVTKIFIPRLSIVVSSALAGIIEFGISFLLLIALIAWYGVPITWQIILVPYFLLLALLLSLALGIMLGAMNVWFRDVEYVLPFSLQVWMFCSPVFYPLGMLSDRWRAVAYLNPLAGLLDGFRAAIFGLPFDVGTIAISSAVIVVLFFISLVIFGRMEGEFADII